MNPLVGKIHETSFIELVTDAAKRDELVAYLGADSGEARSAAALIGVVAGRCKATAAQLQVALDGLAADGRPAARRLIEELLPHPAVPEPLLLRFATDAGLVPVLAQRRGPRALIELLVARYAEPEAITTLALDHLGAAGAPDDAFRDFLIRHRDVELLELNVQRAPHLDAAKRAIATQIFGDPGERTPQPRRRTRRR